MVDEPIHIAKRSGKNKSGGNFSMKVAFSGFAINGVNMSNQDASEALADIMVDAMGAEKPDTESKGEQKMSAPRRGRPPGSRNR